MFVFIWSFLFISLTAFGSTNTVAPPPPYQQYDWPKELTREAGVKIMLTNLGVPEPVILLLPDGKIANDFLLDHDRGFMKKTGGLNGYWIVEGAQIEKPEVFLIDGPANIRVRPSEEVIASWSDGLPVRLLKSKGDWKLVSNYLQKFGWTSKKNLKEIPKGKILLNPLSELAKKFPKSLLAEDGLNGEIVEILKLKSEGKCPQHLTEAELDGVGGDSNGDSDRYEGKAGLQNARIDAYLNCPEGKAIPVPKTLTKPFPKMKSNECNCFNMNDIGSNDMKLKAKDWNEFQKSACESMRYHFRCNQYSELGEGSMPTVYICPKTCF